MPEFLFLKNSTFSNCMVGNSTHTARTNAEAYANTTIDTKYKACNKQEGHFSLSLTVHEKETWNYNPKTPGCLAGKAGWVAEWTFDWMTDQLPDWLVDSD